MPPRRYRRRGAKDPIDGSLAAPFNVFNPHDGKAPIYDGESIIVTSIDPGIKNCGVYIFKYNLLNGRKRSLYLARLQFSQEENNHYISSIKKFEDLEKKSEILSRSHYIVIEKQMTISTQNTRMGQHLITFFSTFLRNKGKRPIIMEFSNQAKTKLLKCPPKMKKPDYKKWCYRKAIDLLESRDNEAEEKYIECLTITKKKDDMGDAICQGETFIMAIETDFYDYPKPQKKESVEKEDEED